VETTRADREANYVLRNYVLRRNLPIFFDGVVYLTKGGFDVTKVAWLSASFFVFPPGLELLVQPKSQNYGYERESARI
jgi:hypothetical protein